MRSAATTVKQYLNELPEERKPIFAELDRRIRESAPELARTDNVFMLYGMIGYGKFHYKYASGREGDWAVIGLASQKNYTSLYLCVADDKGYLAEQNKHRLGKVSVGKSCIRFKKLEDINLDVLSELLKTATALSREGKYAV